MLELAGGADGEPSPLDTLVAMTTILVGAATTTGIPQKDTTRAGNALKLGDATAPHRQKPPPLGMKFNGDSQQLRFFLAQVLIYMQE